jgi:hypothetical protein
MPQSKLEKNMKKTLLISAALGVFAASANAMIVFEDGFETYDYAGVGAIIGNDDERVWGPNGALADHPNFQPPGGDPGDQGTLFAYYSPENGELVATNTGVTFQEGLEYIFTGKAVGGGAPTNEEFLTLHIGYNDGEEFADFTSVVFTQTDISGLDSWSNTDPVSLLADASVAGKEMWIAFGPVEQGSDVWFDSAQVEAVPEPATMLALGAGLAALAARRRSKRA